MTYRPPRVLDESNDGRRVNIVFFDLMHTVLAARPSLGMQFARIYREVAGIRVGAHEALCVTERIHLATPRTNDPDADWTAMNRRILAELAHQPLEEIPLEVARAIRPRVMQERGNYGVRHAMRALLGYLVRRVPLGIASTQEWNTLQEMLDYFRVRRYFRDDLIFTSDRISHQNEPVDKPTATFWRVVRVRVGIDDPRSLPLVGNSLRTDAPATRFGHPVVLLDTCGHQRIYLPNDPHLFFCRSTNAVRRALTQLGLPS